MAYSQDEVTRMEPRGPFPTIAAMPLLGFLAAFRVPSFDLPPGGYPALPAKVFSLRR